jgi:hypothetical protein
MIKHFPGVPVQRTRTPGGAFFWSGPGRHRRDVINVNYRLAHKARRLLARRYPVHIAYRFVWEFSENEAGLLRFPWISKAL